jgi:hypothetical protein
MALPPTDSPRPTPLIRPLALALAVLVLLLAVVVIPLVPETYRPWNFTAFGAVALFVAARGGRFGLGWALLLVLGTKLASDLLNYAQHRYDPDYLPSAVVYAGFAAYALLGWAFLRRGGGPVRVAGVTFAAGLLFFLVTNFFAWLGQALPYPRTPAGLLGSYWMALPFWRGTLLGDFTFVCQLFGLHAILSRVIIPAGRLAPVRIEDAP